MRVVLCQLLAVSGALGNLPADCVDDPTFQDAYGQACTAFVSTGGFSFTRPGESMCHSGLGNHYMIESCGGADEQPTPYNGWFLASDDQYHLATPSQVKYAAENPGCEAGGAEFGGIRGAYGYDSAAYMASLRDNCKFTCGHPCTVTVPQLTTVGWGYCRDSSIPDASTMEPGESGIRGTPMPDHYQSKMHCLANMTGAHA